jgi:UDP-N-acetylglucosamine diphosphorylase/glucosamine-1-phosphate N-acetyltransferase
VNIEQILIFEDNLLDLYPFSLIHPNWELRVGALRVFEKYQKLFPNSVVHFFSPIQKRTDSFQKRFNIEDKAIEKKNTLVVNASFIPDSKYFNIPEEAILKALDGKPNKSFIIKSGDKNRALFLDADEIINPSEIDKAFFARMLTDFYEAFANIDRAGGSDIQYLWDAIYANEQAIRDDSQFFENYSNFDASKYANVIANNPNNIKLGDKVKIEPFTYLNASEGPIIIDDNAKIMANSIIIGPCYIGKNTIIKAGSKIYEKTSIGEFCKIGGEVENTIFQAYSNKQHDGFLGHSFVSEWVNLGAATNCSDLKNTYGTIKVYLDNYPFDTGKKFLGALIGDHSKTAIGTMFNTGSVVGICSGVSDLIKPEKFVDSFSFGGAKDSPVFDFGKVIEIAKTVAARRGRELYSEEIDLIKMEFDRSTRFRKK